MNFAQKQLVLYNGRTLYEQAARDGWTGMGLPPPRQHRVSFMLFEGRDA